MTPINKLVLGTVQFGLDYGINNTQGQVGSAEVGAILKIAKEKGISEIDTSYAYGSSENVLGNALIEDKYFKIISKLPRTTETPVAVFHKSLNRLRKQRLFGYLIHHFDFFKEKPEIWNDLQYLKNKGFIDKIGFSLYHPSELDYLLEHAIEFDLIQFPYNIFDRQFEPYFAELKQRKILVHTRSVFLQGLFFMNTDKLPEKLAPLRQYLTEVAEFCSENDIKKEELTLNGVIHNNNIDGVLIGIDNHLQLISNIESVWAELPVYIIDFINNLQIRETDLLNPQNWN